MNHSIPQQRALAAYNAQQNKARQAVRQRRIAKLRRKVQQQCLTDRSGWLFAAATVGAAFAIIFLR